ncbi:hypothetical protein ES288_A10G253900v1 [Gossypium darwinii]|uniref:Uncharacterized protein n=1 Tax=Gossypium darwinii TaxID=34276 RepID=A0A5D2F3H2_GOSDA|nr:hypothetical protein ES288_A10G253900v1 [Gossypium darwinii]
MSHSSQKSTVHNLQTTEDQQQSTEEDHQHLVLEKFDDPIHSRIHEPQVSISAKNKIAPSKPPPPAAAPLVAHLELHNLHDEQPLPTTIEPSFKSIPRSPSSPASHAGAYPYPHFPLDESRGYLQSTVASPVVGYLDPKGLPQVPEKVSPPASNLPQHDLHPKEVLLQPPSEPPSSRPCCACIIL